MTEDISKVGLSERVDAKLKRLQEEKHFTDMRDAYRVGIALAIACGIRPPEIIPPKVSRYNISQIDEDKSIETAISLLMDTEGVPPYRWAERLAEWGVEKLSQESEKGQIDFLKLLTEAKENTKVI
ncbi:MAG: hypothetical protein ACXWT1_02835 [Methylobacter sp.]